MRDGKDPDHVTKVRKRVKRAKNARGAGNGLDLDLRRGIAASAVPVGVERRKMIVRETRRRNGRDRDHTR